MKQTIKFLTALLVVVAMSSGAWAQTKEITYLNYVGGTAAFAEAKQSATALTSTSDNISGWYYVEGTVTITDRKLKLADATQIILCDGATLSITNTGGYGIDASANKLTIYAQSSGAHAGKLTINSGSSAIIGPSDLTIHGGNISATSDIQNGIACGNLTINGGQVDAKGESTGRAGFSVDNVKINGGKVTATGGKYGMIDGNGIDIEGGQVTATGGTAGIIAYDGTITLGWTNATDFIKASSYSTRVVSGHMDVKTASGKDFEIEGGSLLSGGTLVYDLDAIAGKTLTPDFVESCTVSFEPGITGGTVGVDKAIAFSGERVAITVTPDAGNMLASLTYSDGTNTYGIGTGANDIKRQANDYVITMPDDDITVNATFGKGPALVNGLKNATVTFYDGGTAEPTGFDTAAPGTPVIATDAGKWIVAHVVPADGYWTDPRLLMAYEAVTSLARTRAPGLELPRSVTLLKRDTYTDGSNTLERQDGAGWYYYQIPATHTVAAGYTASVIDGEVVRKFDFSTDNETNVSQSGNVVTVTHGTADAWTAEVSFNAVEFPFTGENIGPEITGVTIKKGSTTILVMTAEKAALHLRKPVESSNQIGDGIGILTNAVSDYTCFLRSAYGDDVFVGDATYSIVVPFEGSGTSASPWKIQTPADLVLLGKCVNVGGFEFPNSYLVQTANLVMTGVAGFEPIGIVDPSDGSWKFCGSYDGKDYTISGINYTNSTAPSYDGAYSCMGLFGQAGTDDYAATIKGVTLIDCTFTATAESSVASAGCIVGKIVKGEVSGCTVKGNSSVSASSTVVTGAIVGQASSVVTLSKNYYTYDVSVGNSAETREDYAFRGTWKDNDVNPELSTWIDINDATEGAMLLVRKATVPDANANGSKVEFNEVTKGTDRYDKDGDDFYYAVGQSVTLTVTTGTSTADGDIRTFQDELTTLTMNGTDIKDALSFTMPDADATVAATFTPSDWFTINSNQKEWMTYYQEWGNYEITDGAGTGKTIKVLTISTVDIINMTATATDLEGVCYKGMPSLFYCQGGLPTKLLFTPTKNTTTVTAASAFKGGLSNLTPGLEEKIYLLVGSEFLQTDIGAGGSKDFDIHKCVIILGSASAGSRLIIVEDDCTGIGSVQRMTGDGESHEWYLLDGRKLNAKPSRPGLYINNNKKVVIK